VPRVAKLMALALHFEHLLRTGEIASYSELGRLGQVTRARICQIMNLTCLAPDLQEALLLLPRTDRGRDRIILADLQPIAALYTCVQAQKRGWDNCPTKSIPAGPMEAFVLAQIQDIARDPASFTRGRSLPDSVAAVGAGRVAAVSAALAALDAASPMLTPEAQARVLEILVQRVEYDGNKEAVTIAFHPAAIQALAEQRAAQAQEKTT